MKIKQKTNEELIKEIEHKLKENKQKLMIKKFTRKRIPGEKSKKEIILTNDVYLNDTGFNDFINCVMGYQSTNIDYIFSSQNYRKRLIEKRKERRKYLNSLNGIKVWDDSEIRESICEKLKNRVPWNKGLKGTKGHKQTEETKRKISLKNSGKNNGMYGKKHTEDIKKAHSIRIKKLIKEGKFTPNSNNINTHWEHEINGKKFRSSWEAVFYKIYQPNNIEHEKLRIEYYDTEKNVNRIYIVDFIDTQKKLVFEVKPLVFQKTQNMLDKKKFLDKWCVENKYKFKFIDETWIVENYDKIMLEIQDKKIKEKMANVKNRFDKKNK